MCSRFVFPAGINPAARRITHDSRAGGPFAQEFDMNLPMSRWDRWCMVVVSKPVVWALMLCTGGATLMMVQSMAEMPGRPTPPAVQAAQAATQTAAGTVAANSGAVSTVQLEIRSDEQER
jgi:hypothetical protein